MKTLKRVAPYVVSAFIALLLALCITFLGWYIQIEGRAFHCTDDSFAIPPFADFWTNLNAHQGAGDTLGPGWTWEKIRAVQIFYQIGFFALWFGGSFALGLLYRKYNKIKVIESSIQI